VTPGSPLSNKKPRITRGAKFTHKKHNSGSYLLVRVKFEAATENAPAECVKPGRGKWSASRADGATPLETEAAR